MTTTTIGRKRIFITISTTSTATATEWSAIITNIIIFTTYIAAGGSLGNLFINKFSSYYSASNETIIIRIKIT